MLTKIREKTQGIIASFIVVLIAIPFALWGVNSYFEGGGDRVVAEVNGTEISERQYRSSLEQFRAQLGAQAESREFREMIVQGMIEQMLLVEDAERKGYRLSDARLASMIREAPQFRTNGQFDPERYRALLRTRGMSPAEFEQSLRRESMSGQLQHGLVESAFVTAGDVDAVVRLWLQRRDIGYALVVPDPRQVGDVDDAAVVAHYEANKAAYTLPEQVRIAFIKLSVEDLVRRHSPSESELRAAYEQEAGRYSTPAQRRAAHILIALPPDAPKAQVDAAHGRLEGIQKELKQGADFAALARKHSADTATAAQGGDLGELSPGLLPPALEQAAYALKANEVSGPVRTEYGLHLVKLTSYTPAKRKPFEAVRAELAQGLTRRWAEEKYYENLERLRNLAYEHPDSLKPAAEALGLNIQESEWFGKRGGAGVAGNPRVVQAAFETEVAQQQRNSDVLETGDNQAVALRVVEHRPERARPLAEVRDAIARTLLYQAALARARETAQAISDAAAGPQDLKAAAQARKAEYREARAVTRAKPAGLDPRIVTAAFATAPQAAPAVVDLGAQGFAVVDVRQVETGNVADADAELRERARRQLLGRAGSGLYGAYGDGLRRSADVTVYKDRL